MVKTLWVAIPLFPLMALIRLRQGAIRGLGNVVIAQVPLFLVLPALFLIFVCILYLTNGISAPLAIGVRGLSALITLILITWLFIKQTPDFYKNLIPKYKPQFWLKSTLPLFFVGAARIANDKISTVMVGSMIGSKATGVFDVSLKGAMLVSFLAIAINMPLSPIVSELNTLKRKERLQNLVTKSVRMSFFGSLPIALVFIFFGKWVLEIFGKGFSKGSITLAILSTAFLLKSGIGPVALLLNMTGFEKDVASCFGCSAVGNIILSVLLVPIWGIEGAALAISVSMIAMSMAMVFLVYKRLGLYSTILGRINFSPS